MVVESNPQGRFEFPVFYYIHQIHDQDGNRPISEDLSLSGFDQGGLDQGGLDQDGLDQGEDNFMCFPLECGVSCPYGYVIDEWGCFTCECYDFVGVECDENNDCFSFEVCVEGYCETRESSSPTYCMSDEECLDDLWCIDGICE